MNAPPLIVPLDGTSNFRDLGRWPTVDGRGIRPGLVFRSAALARLTDADQDTLARLGVRTICDFRGDAERAGAPSRLDRLNGVAVHALPIEPSVGASLSDILRTRDATGEDVMVLLERAYLSYALEWTHRYRVLFDLVLTPGALPLVFHCAAGKDRTGFAAALMLAALDVPWPAVMADYLATNQHWRGASELAEGLPPAIGETLLRVHAPLLEAAFAAIEAAFGSRERYFAEALGLDAARREQLRALLVE